MVTLIHHDGARVGIVEHDAQGLNALAWFHANAGGQSMSYYLEHGGYSTEEVEEVDCHDVEALLGAIAARAGVTMESAFVPFSQSRNAKPGDDGKVWQSLNWRVTIKRHGREVLTTDYGQGSGHAPASKLRSDGTRYDEQMKRDAIEIECETGMKAARVFSSAGGYRASRIRIDPPSIGEVLQSLVRDADVIDAGGFENWASDLGYDTDSRKAEAIYRACIDIAVKLRASFGESLLAEMRLAASFN